MFIAHAPAGYIVSVSILRWVRQIPASATATIVVAIVGALAPDLDLLYFYLLDHRHSHHHKYFTHWPLLWLALSAATGIWLRLSRTSKPAVLAFVFSLSGVLHVILDSVVGDIWWFAPFIDRPYAMFTVPAVWKPWWLNFILHWSFALELAICTGALLISRWHLNSCERTLAAAEGAMYGTIESNNREPSPDGAVE